jgi:AcrR family transcriptional regulator
MPHEDAPHGRTGRPPVTSRARILTAARTLIDRDGWEKLSIRRLAGELGIGTTTMYHHVRNKQDLLLLLIDEYADQIRLPDLPADPRDRIVVCAAVLHDALAAWPWAAEILTVDGFVGVLSDSALELVEQIVAAAVDHGVTTEQAVGVFRSLWYYTVGEILVRARSDRERNHGEHPALRGGFANLDSPRLPHLAAIGTRWPVLAARDTYRQGLESFVDGLLARPPIQDFPDVHPPST